MLLHILELYHTFIPHAKHFSLRKSHFFQSYENFSLSVFGTAIRKSPNLTHLFRLTTVITIKIQLEKQKMP